VYFSSAIRKTVSMSGSWLRFMSAIWNSYSKSETALSPRMTAQAFFRFA